MGFNIEEFTQKYEHNMNMDTKQDIKPYINRNKEIGRIIKSYRKITGITQNELASDVNVFLTSSGISDDKLSQSYIAKLEGGSKEADNRIIRYLGDVILKTDMVRKMQVFDYVERIFEITKVRPEEICELFMFRYKKDLISFIQNHIVNMDTKEKESETEFLNKFPDSLILESELTGLPVSELANLERIKVDIIMNSTAIFILYLSHLYITNYYTDQSVFYKQFYEQYHTEFKSRKQFIETIDLEYESLNEEDKALFTKLFWGPDKSSDFKNRRVSAILTVYKYVLFVSKFIPDLARMIEGQSESKLRNELGEKLLLDCNEDFDPFKFLAFVYQLYWDPKLRFKANTKSLYNKIIQMIDVLPNDGFLDGKKIKETVQQISNDSNLNEDQKVVYLNPIFDMLDNAQRCRPFEEYRNQCQ